MPKARIISLLVGINEFKYISHLRGCVKDVTEMAKYLKSAGNKYLNVLEPKILINDQATKVAIVDAFEKHLIDQATKDDIVVFHFSGHGTQEIAHEAFKRYEPNGLLEGLVCHDTSKGTEGETTLADKEIRYLIHKLSEKGCDIISIFDCCHSGDFRSGVDNNLLPRKVNTSRLSTKFPGRDWQQFIFSKEKGWETPDEFLNEENHLDELIPQGRHVQLAACLDNELAYEYGLKGQGYLTYSLLEILKNSPTAISYLELQRRITHFLRSKMIDQSPQVYAPRGFQQDVYRNFLYGEQLEQGIQGNLRYNGYKQDWRIDLGAIHGLKAVEEGNLFPISVDVGQKRPLLASIKEVLLNESIIEFPTVKVEGKEEPISTAPNQNGNYKASISGLMMEKINLFLSGDQVGINIFEESVASIKNTLEKENIYFISKELEASYRIVAESGYYMITSPFDNRPLIEKIPGYSEDSVEKVLDKLRHISQWEFTKNLQSTNNKIFNKLPIKLEVHPQQADAKPILLSPTFENPVPKLRLRHATPGEEQLEYKFYFENSTNYDLFVACFYMDPLFGIEIDYFEPAVVELKGYKEQGAKGVWGLNDSSIRLKLPEYIKDFNWKEELIYLKLIIADKPFDVRPFYLNSLKAPTFRNSKGLERVKRSKIAGDANWVTQLFEFRIGNPFYIEE